MSNTADHVGRPQTVEALGQSWTFGRWNRAVWVQFLDWAKDKIADPKREAVAFLGLLPADDRESRAAIVKQALDESLEYLTESSPRVQQALDGLLGMSHLVCLLLKANHTEATDDLAYELVMAIGKDRMRDVLLKCAGVPPKKNESPGNENSPTLPPSPKND